MSPIKLYLNIPFNEKEIAKNTYPIRWDSYERRWYILLNNTNDINYYCEKYCPVDIMGVDNEPKYLQNARLHYFKHTRELKDKKNKLTTYEKFLVKQFQLTEQEISQCF